MRLEKISRKASRLDGGDGRDGSEGEAAVMLSKWAEEEAVKPGWDGGIHGHDGNKRGEEGGAADAVASCWSLDETLPRRGGAVAAFPGYGHGLKVEEKRMRAFDLDPTVKMSRVSNRFKTLCSCIDRPVHEFGYV